MNKGWGCFLGLVLGCAMIAASIYYGPGDAFLGLATAALAIITLGLLAIGYINLRLARRITWFTGAMERHSDQMRQMKAHELGIDMIWWDKTMPEAGGTFPSAGQHGWKFKLGKLYIGIPVEKRQKRPGRIAKLLGVMG